LLADHFLDLLFCNQTAQQQVLLLTRGLRICRFSPLQTEGIFCAFLLVFLSSKPPLSTHHHFNKLYGT
jgi:hypothetical protein